MATKKSPDRGTGKRPAASRPGPAPRGASPRAATPRAATPRAATPRAATPRAATPRAAAPSRAVQPPAPSTGYWLVKSEPESFSFDDLWAAPKRRTGWDGVRNYQARNFLRDTMRVGDLLLYYHSNAEPPGIAGVARVVGPARPDPTQFDPRDEHFDPDAREEAPTWIEREIEAVARLPRFVALDDLKRDARLARMLVLQRGQRLSVQPVQSGEWRVVLELAGARPGDFPTPV